ncbi:MAG: preprotein translocase subunit YajC [Halanaerobiales bacterium]|nr:preprotein translocase subunit YajC [Halanaerobiales bacterium]
MEMFASVLPFVVLFGVFWFFLIRPQQRQQKAHKEMLGNLKAGDQIITIGGIKGKIIKIKEDSIRLRVSANVDIDMVKSSIGRLDPVAKEEIDEKKEANDNKEE